MKDSVISAEFPKRTFSQKLMYIYGWIFVRPRRWFFRKLICSSYIKWLPKRLWSGYWLIPNLHWYVMYRTIFKFCKWLHYEAWRPFCKSENGWITYKPLISEIIHKVGKTTAGFAISGGECFHCGSERGDPVDLSSDETGRTFILERAWTCATQDGTDHRFCGTTCCPVCGYKHYYEDGSL
jgi:hypothetical protein